MQLITLSNLRKKLFKEMMVELKEEQLVLSLIKEYSFMDFIWKEQDGIKIRSIWKSLTLKNSTIHSLYLKYQPYLQLQYRVELVLLEKLNRMIDSLKRVTTHVLCTSIPRELTSISLSESISDVKLRIVLQTFQEVFLLP